MNNANYLGYSGWRLPTMVDTGTPGCNFSYTGTDCGYNVQTGSASSTVYSEMASMFYDTLGNLAYADADGNYPQAGYGVSNTGPFSNLQSHFYWTGLGYAPDPSKVWSFYFTSDGNAGRQEWDNKDDFSYAWAVHSGDIGAAIVPLPAAVWLFGSGVLGLIGISRHKKTS